MEHQACTECASSAHDHEHCEDHSGLAAWMKGIATLLVLSAGLLSYSVFWQAPAIRTEIAREIARVDGEMKLVKRDVEDLTKRVDRLEQKGAGHAR